MLERRDVAVSGHMIQLKADEFWEKLPIYHGQTVLKFSEGWLDNWKGRFGIKKVKLHDEGGSFDITGNVEEMMNILQTEVMGFQEKDVYNMDETAFYWRRAPDHTLATKQLHGMKKSKSRWTARMCGNSDGSDRCSIWLIGRYRNSRPFKNINRTQVGEFKVEKKFYYWRTSHHIPMQLQNLNI